MVNWWEYSPYIKANQTKIELALYAANVTGSIWKDASPNLRDANLLGSFRTTPIDPSGTFGNALLFEGGQYVTGQHSIINTDGMSYTVQAWVKGTSGTIWAFNDSRYFQHFGMLNSIRNDITFHVQFIDNSYMDYILQIPVGYDANIMNNFAFVVEQIGTDVKVTIYLNSVQINTYNRLNVTISKTALPYAIGNFVPTFGTIVWMGLIDEVLAYSAGLSPTEILQNFQNSPYWHIRQGLVAPQPNTGCQPLTCSLQVL